MNSTVRKEKLNYFNQLFLQIYFQFRKACLALAPECLRIRQATPASGYNVKVSNMTKSSPLDKVREGQSINDSNANIIRDRKVEWHVVAVPRPPGPEEYIETGGL